MNKKQKKRRTVLRKLGARKIVAIVFVLGLLTLAGMAQVPTSGNVYFGYALNHGTTGLSDTGTLNGWDASVEGKVFPHIGLVFDVGQQFGNLFLPPLGFSADERTDEYLFGPRLSFTVSKFRPFVHAMVGAGHLHEINHFFGVEHSETAFADAIGGGVDYHLIPRVSWRLQLDSLTTNFHSDWQHNTRFTTGLAVRF
jgi:hypothetical protein